jgi:hypothetical protein
MYDRRCLNTITYHYSLELKSRKFYKNKNGWKLVCPIFRISMLVKTECSDRLIFNHFYFCRIFYFLAQGNNDKLLYSDIVCRTLSSVCCKFFIFYSSSQEPRSQIKLNMGWMCHLNLYLTAQLSVQNAHFS